MEVHAFCGRKGGYASGGDLKMEWRRDAGAMEKDEEAGAFTIRYGPRLVLRCTANGALNIMRDTAKPKVRFKNKRLATHVG